MENNNLNKNAFIENILLWFIMIVSFIGILFLVLEYSKILRINHTLSMMSDYGARMRTKGKDDATIIAGLNNLKLKSISTINTQDFICSTNFSINNNQLIFNVTFQFNSTLFNQMVRQRTIIFNESGNFQTECEVTLTGATNE